MSDENTAVRRLEGDKAILVTQEYINDKHADILAEECKSLCDQGVRHFVFNMMGTKIVNSVGIAIIMEIIEDTIELDGSVSFCCVTPTISKTYQIMGLHQLANIFNNEEEALAAV